MTPVAPAGRLAGAPRHAAARLAYVGVVFAATLRALDLDDNLHKALWRLGRALTVTGLHGADVIDGVRNVALFAGFGVVWVATARPTRLGTRVLHATVLGLALSVTVELVQCFSPVRRASILDVATNGIGALAGAAAMAAAVYLTARLRADAAGGDAARGRSARVADTALPLVLVAAPYLAACWLEAFSPFGSLDRVPGAWGGLPMRWNAAVRWLAQTGGHGISPWDVPLFAAGGALGAAALLARRWSPGAAVAALAVAGALTLPVAELLRGLSGGELRPTALVLRVAALGTGVLGTGVLGTGVLGTTLVAARDARAPDARPSAAGRRDAWALAAYLLVIALWSLRPLDLVAPDALGARLAGVAWSPLAAQFADFGVHSVADLAIGFLLWLPVGAWLAARTALAADAERRASTRWRALALGVALGVAAEASQLVLRGRTVDSTDALVHVAGVLVGWSLLRRADARAAAERASAERASAVDQSALGYVSGGSSSARQAGARSSGSTARVTS